MLEIAFLLLGVLNAPPAGDTLAAEVIFVQRSLQSMKSICPRSRARLDACTRFVDWQLSARCGAKGRGWGMQVTASYNAYVFFVDSTAIGHEMLHVRDVERDVREHVHKLERRAFPAEQTCRDAAAAAEGGFHAALQESARRSQRRRD